jgi:hypothetical protein
MLFQPDKLMILQELDTLHYSKAAPVHDIKLDGRRRIKLHSFLTSALYGSVQPHIPATLPPEGSS